MASAQGAVRKRRIAQILTRALVDSSVLVVFEPERALSAKAVDSSTDVEERCEARRDGERRDDKHDNFKCGDHQLVTFR